MGGRSAGGRGRRRGIDPGLAVAAVLPRGRPRRPAARSAAAPRNPVESIAAGLPLARSIAEVLASDIPAWYERGHVFLARDAPASRADHPQAPAAAHPFRRQAVGQALRVRLSCASRPRSDACSVARDVVPGMIAAIQTFGELLQAGRSGISRFSIRWISWPSSRSTFRPRART